MATSISIGLIKDGIKKQKSVSYIDPNATDKALIDFAAEMVNLMASATYENTTKIDRNECKANKTTRPIQSVILVNNSKHVETTLIDGVYTGAYPANKFAQNIQLSIYMTVPSLNSFSTQRIKHNIKGIIGNWSLYSYGNTPSIGRLNLAVRDDPPTVGDICEGSVIIEENETYAETEIKFRITVSQEESFTAEEIQATQNGSDI